MEVLRAVRKFLGILTDLLNEGRKRNWWQEKPKVQALVTRVAPGNRAKIAWAVAIVLLLGYEAYSIMNNAPGDTLSEAVWEIAHYPFVPFAAGFVCGHLFWQRRSK